MEGEDEVGQRGGKCAGGKEKDRAEPLCPVTLEVGQGSNPVPELRMLGLHDWSDVTISGALFRE